MTRGQLRKVPKMSPEQLVQVWQGVLASADRRSKNIRIRPVVVPELKLGNVKRQVLGADLVESTDHPALKHRPKTLNRIGVDRADHVRDGVLITRAMRLCGIRAV